MADEVEVQSGNVTIELSRPISVDGANISVLTMREPTVNDQLVMDKTGGSDFEKEITMLANLCMLTPKDIKSLTTRDYKKLQRAFVGFID